ncbi:DUF7556 family protein [Halogranum rubrum]|uniref:DUF7556 family protein n=1 Tax=Halogranum rubrum TaxID=553466 RepID=UPI0012FA49D2|nr:hypothetical protein [Halogranum salarium]
MNPHKPECHNPSQSLQWSRLQAERTTVAEQSEDAIMAVVDDAGDHEQFVIADTTRDDAWVTVDADESLLLDEWR